MGKKYGVSDSSLAQTNYALGWVNGDDHRPGPQEHQGRRHDGLDEGGSREIKNLNAGDLSPAINLTPKCHMGIQQVRPYTYNWSKKTQVPVGSFAQWSKFITNTQAAPGTCGKPRSGK